MKYRDAQGRFLKGIFISPEIRFWPKVSKGDSNLCWEWLGAKNNKNYGVFNGGKDTGKIYAHRFSYILNKGQIPQGLWVLHHCDNPPCVNPDHLFLGNNSINMRDCVAKGRFNNGPRRLGEANNKAKLTAADVIEIRALRANFSERKLAKKFSVSSTAIRYICIRRNWAHIP